MSGELFTQTLCVLLRRDVPLDQVAQVLAAYKPQRQEESGESWEFGGPSLVFDAADLEHGFVVVDVVTHPWPDDMGVDEQESTLFQAWDDGQFGPFTFPGSLERASEQSWSWPEGNSVASQSIGFIRIRLGYRIDQEDSEQQLPEEFAVTLIRAGRCCGIGSRSARAKRYAESIRSRRSICGRMCDCFGSTSNGR